MHFTLLQSALVEVSSPEGGTREQCLKVNILDRYYADNVTLQEEFFAPGKDTVVRLGSVG